MGLIFINVTVANPADPSRAIEEQFLVDSGAVYSLVPRRHLEGIGIEPATATPPGAKVTGCSPASRRASVT